MSNPNHPSVTALPTSSLTPKTLLRFLEDQSDLDSYPLNSDVVVRLLQFFPHYKGQPEEQAVKLFLRHKLGIPEEIFLAIGQNGSAIYPGNKIGFKVGTRSECFLIVDLNNAQVEGPFDGENASSEFNNALLGHIQVGFNKGITTAFGG